MKKYIYTIVAATAMLASCSQDAELNEVIDNQSTAITEIGATTSAETRAVVSSSDNTKVNWETGDQLGAFGEGATGAVAYTLDGTGGSTSGTFKNASSTIIAVQAMMYPYQNTATWADNKLTCEIPTVQTATAGSFDKNAAIMYSIGSETNATLNYGVAFLKVNIPSGTTNVHAITVYSSTALSGKVDITSTGVAAASTGSQTYVTLQADASNGALAAGDYYIAVKPGSKENLSIAYKYTDHTAKAKQGSSGGSLVLEKGHVKAISADFNTGTVREAKQLWADGPYFATENAGNMSWTAGMTAWGSAWTIASESALTTLIADYKTDPVYTQENSTWGFKFTGKADGYTGKSIFLPSGGGDGKSGNAYYWSSAEAGSFKARYVYLDYYDGNFNGRWRSGSRSSNYFVRLVLR